MEDYTTSKNFSNRTLSKISRDVNLAIGFSDWLTRKELLDGLNFVQLPISCPQLYKDIQLLGNLDILGFNYFKGDKGFDRTSSTAIVIFRWIATRRGRGQAALHLPELMEIILNYEQQQRSNYSTIEVEYSSIS